jgi:dipeptidyl-peptidase-4
MKKTVLLLLSFIVLIVNVKASQDFLKKITSGYYKSQTITNIIPLADAELYAQITDNGKQILAYSYKKGDVCDTIIDIEKIKGCPIDSIEGFLLDSLEQRVLLYANTEKIYRRSFKADYYVFNRKRNTFDALSENGKQQCAVMDGGESHNSHKSTKPWETNGSGISA